MTFSIDQPSSDRAVLMRRALALAFLLHETMESLEPIIGRGCGTRAVNAVESLAVELTEDETWSPEQVMRLLAWLETMQTGDLAFEVDHMLTALTGD